MSEFTQELPMLNGKTVVPQEWAEDFPHLMEMVEQQRWQFDLLRAVWVQPDRLDEGGAA